MTIRAIDSIFELNQIDSCKIVIVDNGTPEMGGSVLEKKYRGDTRVCILKPDENLGFSRGNNFGFRYIRKYYDPDFVIAMNNDILFPQADMLEKIQNVYRLDPFYVAGPDVYVPQRFWHSSPLKQKIMSESEYDEYCQKWLLGIKKYQSRFSFDVLIEYILEQCRDSVALRILYYVWRKLHGQKGDYITPQTGCILQGSCLIVDRRFIHATDKLFSPETFLYEEENILTLRCIRNGWSIRYIPELLVYHTCQGSTQIRRQSYKQYRIKKIKEFKNVISAMEIYKEYFRNEQKAINSRE